LSGKGEIKARAKIKEKRLTKMWVHFVDFYFGTVLGVVICWG